MRIAFAAPIKPPDHAIASGDRLIAANTVEALRRAGHEVVLATRFIAYAKRHEPGLLARRRTEALAEAEAVIGRLRSAPPDLFLTYHPYCKAPDWIGPRVADAFAVPYVTLEAARTGQGAKGDVWADWRAQAQAGFARADLHICLKPNDRAMLLDVLGPDAPVADLAPFLDVPAALPRRTGKSGDPVRLVTVAMMRPGKKTANYALLARAMAQVGGSWTLDIVGDGPERGEVERLFAPLADRVRFLGAMDRDDVLRAMAGADVFVWPGLAEPIGMVYLEAQAMGLPVAALRDMGVPLVVDDGRTGLLADRHDAAGLATVIERLVADEVTRASLGARARDHVVRHHSLDRAAVRLDELIAPLAKRDGPR